MQLSQHLLLWTLDVSGTYWRDGGGSQVVYFLSVSLLNSEVSFIVIIVRG